PRHHGLSIFRHAAIQIRAGVVVFKGNGVEIAGSQAPAAAYTVAGIYGHFPGGLVEYQALVGAFPLAFFAAPAKGRIDLGLAAAMLVLFARPGAAAHADVFDGAAKAGHLMALEVG